MAFSLALTGAPELGAYLSPVRRLLVERALARLHAESRLATWLQIILPVGSALLGVVLAVWLMDGFDSGTSLPRRLVITINANFLGGGIGCVTGTLIWLAVRVRRLGPYLRR